MKEIIICASYFSRGNHFRREFTNLGAVRSLIPNHVHVMALTATATERAIARVSAILGLVAPKIITVSPDKSNICYWVKPRGSMKEMCEPLLHKLRHQRTAMPRVIIYCKKCDDCASIYYFFLSSLKHEFTEPISAPNVSQFRLVDMYTGVTHKDVQDSIIEAFRDSAAPLRIVVATVAFGMGVDCCSVNQVIHWGPATDMEGYLQECGRAGRNGEFASALLYVKKTDLRYLSDEAKSYCLNQTICRRKMLLSFFSSTSDYNFPIGCSCCDVCASACECCNCKCKDFPSPLL